MRNVAKILLVLAVFIAGDRIANTYTLEDCTVYTVESSEVEGFDLVTVEDKAGNLWAFETERGFEYNDNTRITLRLNDHGTEENILDDAIVKVIVK